MKLNPHSKPIPPAVMPVFYLGSTESVSNSAASCLFMWSACNSPHVAEVAKCCVYLFWHTYATAAAAVSGCCSCPKSGHNCTCVGATPRFPFAQEMGSLLKSLRANWLTEGGVSGRYFNLETGVGQPFLQRLNSAQVVEGSATFDVASGGGFK